MPNSLLTVLAQEKDELLKKLALINQMIKEYDDANDFKKVTDNNPDINIVVGSENIDKYEHYNINYPIRKKIVTIIKNENRFLHVREIAAIAHQFEQEIPVSVFIKKISPALSTLKISPETGLISIAVGQSHFNTFWGSKHWIDNSGAIIEAHMYNPNQIAGFNKEKYSV
jgi:hypothetical protein